MMKIISVFTVALFVSVLILKSPAVADENDDKQDEFDSNTLAICVHPYKSSTLIYRSFSPMAKYLSQKIGKPVAIHIAANYEEQIKTVGGNSMCIGYMGPASYVKLVQQYGKQRILARQAINGKPEFHGKIISRKDSEIKTLADLKGKRFAFGDPDSTMSHLVPRYLLIEAGITSNTLKSYKFLGNHDNVALGVLMGNFDAGAVKEEVYYKYEKRGLKAIATTPALSEHLFVASRNISDSIVKALRDALLRANQSAQGLNALHAIKTTISAFVPAKDSNYDNLRKILHFLKAHGITK